jgi:vesicle transport through interaction with t-SNAREs protein 1
MALDSSNSIPFERYDDEFLELLRQIEKAMEEDPPSVYADGLFQQAEDLIKQMAIDARSVPDASSKRTLLDRVRTHKHELSSFQTQSAKSGLFRVGSGGGNNTTSDSRSHRNDRERWILQQNEDTLVSQNDTLERARRTMQETEQVALEITEELGNNREKLMNAHGRVREVTGLTGRAGRILGAMNQRAVQQKCILYGVGIGLVLGFFLLLYTLWS